MSYKNAIPRVVAIAEETTFADLTIDLGTSGDEIWCVNPDTSGLTEQMLDNENYVLRPEGKHKKVRALRNGGKVSTGHYLTAKGTNAAEAAASTMGWLDRIMRAGLGFVQTSFSIGLAGGTASAPEVDSDPGYVKGHWVFAVDASTGEGQFYRVISIATVTLTLDRDLHFTPDPGGADRLYAVNAATLHKDSLSDSSDGDHKTIALGVAGEHGEDYWLAAGCKPTVTVSGFNPGEMPMLNVEWMVADWALSTKPTLGTAPEGEAPLVTGRGSDTRMFFADFGSPLTDTQVFWKCEPKIGITHQQVMSPHGQQGVVGYTASGWGSSGVSLAVPFDADWYDDYEDQTEKHLLVQVGSTPTRAVAIYFPRLEPDASPVRGAHNDTTSMDLSYRALENTASAGSLTGDNLEAWRSSVVVLRVA